MDRNIEFEVLGIAGVLDRYRLHVPPNQREYAWTEEEVSELLQDLANAILKGGDTYFLGTLVLTKSADNKLEVADGQQRLATTMMIIATIRDRFLQTGDDMRVQSVESDYLFTIDMKARDTLPKLILNFDDNEYFKNAILTRPGKRSECRPTRRSHRLISGAATLIREHFDALELQVGAANFPDALIGWLDYLNNKASVVALRVSNAANAFIMFETLNDRGLKTSQADLVKNYLFAQAGDRLVEAQSHWSTMRGAIETVGEADMTMEFLRLALCVQFGVTRERDVMTKVEESSKGKSESIRLIHFFNELSGFYAAILNPDHATWNNYDEAARKSVQAINALGVTQVRPLMLSVARHFTPAQTAKAFRRMVAWTVRFLIMGQRGGKLDDGYGRLANEIYKGNIKSDAELVEAAKTFVPSDSQFSAAFATARVTVSRLARYYLRSLEMTARGESNPEFLPNDGASINLEHVLSQNDPDTTAVESHGARIGNLALLQATKNSEIGSSDFSVKRPIYAASSFLLTAQIGELLTWGPADIEERQKTLANFAVKTWPLV
jgi:hypothetical protein